MRSRLRAALFAIERGVADARRRPLLSASIVTAVAASLMAIGLVWLATHNLSHHADTASKEAQLVVFLEPDVSETRAIQVGRALSELEGIVATEIVSALDARARLEVALSEDGALLADLETSFFPMSIEVTLQPGLREAASLHPFMDRLEAVRGVESVEVVGDWVDRAGTLFSALGAAAQMLLFLFAGCAAFVVASLMRLADDRGPERELCRLLGASAAFTGAPVIVSGVLRGALGGVIACLALYVFYTTSRADVSAVLQSVLGGGHIEFLPLRSLLGLVAGGAFVGGVGAALAGRGRVA